MPCELTNAPIEFMDLNRYFRTFLDKFLILLTGDILSTLRVTKSMKNIWERITGIRREVVVFQVLYIRFLPWNVSFLGYIVYKDGICFELAKIEAVKDGRKSFLGLTWYYHRYVEEFFKIATPLTRLTQKSIRFEWDDKCEQVF